MRSFYDFDPEFIGSSGLLFIGNKIVTLLRDGNTQNHPYTLDLPGGRTEQAETPFETYVREVREEVGVTIRQDDIHYVRRYESERHPGKYIYFVAARVPTDTKISFGDEGIYYRLMTVTEYLESGDGWPIHQEHATDYLVWRKSLGLPLPR